MASQYIKFCEERDLWLSNFFSKVYNLHKSSDSVIYHIIIYKHIYDTSKWRHNTCIAKVLYKSCFFFWIHVNFFRTSPFLICLRVLYFCYTFLILFKCGLRVSYKHILGIIWQKKKKTFFVRSKRGVGPPPHPLEFYCRLYIKKKRI